ncbi:MAG: endonuclease [Oscillatoriales cyanobacterium C42_A2020_001]|nr:endonuclease [Leptolyngbyaceae cyanobacterium C42_A2020_001]
MNFTDILEETEERFGDREVIRSDNHEKLDAGLLLQADSPERVEKRLKRLGFDTPTAKLLAGSDVTKPPAAMIDTQESLNTFERILAKNDLMAVNFLERGAKAARPVGRIRVRMANGSAGFGTGFLVSPRLLLTNNHVLPNAESAALSRVEFDYQDGLDGQPMQAVVFDLEPDALFLTDTRLDYSLVAVKSVARNNISLESFGWHPLIEAEGKVIIGESVSIIQHPNGEPKQIALRENLLVDVLPDFLHYQTDTAPGSSGSPVFNDQWELVALHHSGVPKRDENGQILNVDGEAWKSDQGENRVAWIANEGVRVSRLIQHIKSQSIPTQAQPLLTELFNSSQSPTINGALTISNGGSTHGTRRSPGSEMTPKPDNSSPNTNLQLQAIASEDGSVTWTIPLQVSVRLGQPTTTAPTTPTAIAPVPTLEAPSPEPAPAAIPTPMLEVPTESDLKQALKELKAAAKKPYYDESGDRKKRDTYYQTILGKVQSLSAKELYQELSRLVNQTHKTRLSYQPSKYLYPWIDLHPDLKIRSIYSEQTFEPEELIRADFQVAQLLATRSQELQLKESFNSAQLLQELNVLEASLPYNCEHVVPQSWFAKKEPMRGDLHHLFACETRCNSFRGNTPYFDFEDFGTAIRDNCGKVIGEKFEPNAGKGAVARATLYFLLRYPNEINKTEREYQESRLPILLDWHKSYPVSEYEQHRNAAIFEKQGNRNPLIDFPDWADKIAFQLGLG